MVYFPPVFPFFLLEKRQFDALKKGREEKKELEWNMAARPLWNYYWLIFVNTPSLALHCVVKSPACANKRPQKSLPNSGHFFSCASGRGMKIELSSISHGSRTQTRNFSFTALKTPAGFGKMIYAPS